MSADDFNPADMGRCVLNDGRECLARTPAACLCAQMPKPVYLEALRHFDADADADADADLPTADDVKGILGNRVEEIRAQLDTIMPQFFDLLAGLDPDLQGFILSDLTAMHIAGFQHPGLRQEILELHIETVRALLPGYVRRSRKMARAQP